MMIRTRVCGLSNKNCVRLLHERVQHDLLVQENHQLPMTVYNMCVCGTVGLRPVRVHVVVKQIPFNKIWKNIFFFQNLKLFTETDAEDLSITLVTIKAIMIRFYYSKTIIGK